MKHAILIASAILIGLGANAQARVEPPIPPVKTCFVNVFDVLKVRTRPNGPVFADLAPGDQVELIDSWGSWRFVQSLVEGDSHLTGWVPAKNLIKCG